MRTPDGRTGGGEEKPFIDTSGERKTRAVDETHQQINCRITATFYNRKVISFVVVADN